MFDNDFIGEYFILLIALLILASWFRLRKPRFKVERAEVKRRDRRYLGTGGTILLVLYSIIVLGLSLAVVISALPENGLFQKMQEVRYIILATSGAALGASLNTLTSLTTKLDRNALILTNWLWSYLLRVLMAIPLALTLLLCVRGALISTESQITSLNPYGILAATVLMGIFSSPLLDWVIRVTSGLSEKQSQLERQVEQIGAAVGAAILDNYQGFICYSFFESESGSNVEASVVGSADIRGVLLKLETDYTLRVWLQPTPSEQGLNEEIRISDGMDAKIVGFRIAPDSNAVTFNPKNESLSVNISERSASADFRFVTPSKEKDVDIWIEVSQKNRLIEVVTVSASWSKNKSG